jgi:hypothetical protein
MKISVVTALIFSVFIFSNLAFATDGVQCETAGVNYDLCNSGTITKLTYRKSSSSVLISGISAPGCGTGWVLAMPSQDEGAKAMYSALLAAHLSGKTVSLTRVGSGGCVQWDGIWKAPLTEISID